MHTRSGTLNFEAEVQTDPDNKDTICYPVIEISYTADCGYSHGWDGEGWDVDVCITGGRLGLLALNLDDLRKLIGPDGVEKAHGMAEEREFIRLVSGGAA